MLQEVVKMFHFKGNDVDQWHINREEGYNIQLSMLSMLRVIITASACLVTAFTIFSIDYTMSEADLEEALKLWCCTHARPEKREKSVVFLG